MIFVRRPTTLWCCLWWLLLSSTLLFANADIDEYDALDFHEDGLDYSRYCCEQGEKMDFPSYSSIDDVESAYQSMNFFQDLDNKDTCFDLDGTVQICGSYRPHYHEMAVHYPARFLDSIKRVAFVGGGDSMLLHEIIKYPTLELVIGLEIDQKVTRSSFKHFGTQPHWDNEKVQWWYGDAAKSLLMLPKDYFGSFDLVLVDLSETVMSITVTEGLDIFDALGLLLKDEGILVKNELYVEQFSKIWDYTAQIHYYNVPVICSQAMVLGSNKVDFLHRTPKDHEGIENLMMLTLDETEDVYDIYHDYRRNNTRKMMHCKGDDDSFGRELDEQEKSPGILMILEAEDITVPLESSNKLQEIMAEALKKEGFTVVSTVAPSKEHDGIVVATVVLSEGYVIARGWPEYNYVAYDVHLWSAFEKHDAAKNALIEAVGSGSGKSSSSYRIVAGGMFGVSTWKEDAQNRGPRFTRDCERPQMPARDTIMDTSSITTILEDSMALIKDDDIVASVICGYESESCHSMDVLKNHGIVSEVVPIWTCPGLKESSGEELAGCRNTVLNLLMESVQKSNKKIRALVIDPTAPFPMGQIVHKIFSMNAHRIKILTDDIMVMAPMLDPSEDWRRNLMDRFRQEIIVNEPVFLAQVLFNTTDSSMELAMTSSGDEHFVKHLKEVTTSIEKRSDSQIVSDIRNTQGGLFTYQEDFVPTHFYLPDDYDQSSPMEQYMSQKPVGHQTVFQLEVQGTFKLSESVFAEFKEGGMTFPGHIAGINDDGTFNIWFDDGDRESHVDRKNIKKLDSTSLDEEDYLSISKVESALTTTLSSIDSLSGVSHAEVHSFDDMGDGCLLVALWSGGTVSILWDGKLHVDLNFFTFEDNEAAHTEFQIKFNRQVPSLVTVLHDEQPRGYGRVVNFQTDLEEYDDEEENW